MKILILGGTADARTGLAAGGAGARCDHLARRTHAQACDARGTTAGGQVRRHSGTGGLYQGRRDRAAGGCDASLCWADLGECRRRVAGERRSSGALHAAGLGGARGRGWTCADRAGGGRRLPVGANCSSRVGMEAEHFVARNGCRMIARLIEPPVSISDMCGGSKTRRHLDRERTEAVREIEFTHLVTKNSASEPGPRWGWRASAGCR